MHIFLRISFLLDILLIFILFISCSSSHSFPILLIYNILLIVYIIINYFNPYEDLGCFCHCFCDDSAPIGPQMHLK